MRFCLAGGESKKIYQIENGPNVLRQKENKKLHKKLIDKINCIQGNLINSIICLKSFVNIIKLYLTEESFLLNFK